MSERPLKRKNIRCNTLQKNRLVAFMAKNKDLAQSPAAGRVDYEKQNLKWKIIERELAKLGPPRTAEQWKITWRDLKCRAKMSLTPGLWSKYKTKRSCQDEAKHHCSKSVSNNRAQDKVILSIIGHNSPIPIAGAPESSVDLPPLQSGYQIIKSKLLNSSNVTDNTEIEIEVVSGDNSINHKNTIVNCDVDADYEEKDRASIEDRVDPLSSSCHSGTNNYEDVVHEEELNDSDRDSIEDSHSDGNKSNQEVNAIEHHDYTFRKVGAGTAGCVLAARLSEDPCTKVLLVEAGAHMGYFTRVPLTATAAQQGPNDWAVKTAPQKFSSFGMWTQSQFLPRGKGLGGSGQINFLLHGTGHPDDYQRWARLGFEGWSFEDLKPYFVKAFGTVKSEFDSHHCSVDGECTGNKAPMKLKQISEQDELFTAFKQASNLLKDKHTTFRRPTATVKDGRRHGTLDGYLKPALGRKNLHVLLKTQAVSIRFENNTASSLYILQNHRELNNIFVKKEIILCAGAIKTPQILILSGIGPEGVLRRLRIKPVSVNEDVGNNFHDHMNMPVYVSIKRPLSITLSKVFTFGAVFDYLWQGGGPLSFPPVAGVEFQNKSAVILFSMGTASERLLRDLSNYKPKVFRETFPFFNQTSKEGFMFLATCLHPSSRGRVTVNNPSIYIAPVVDPAYLMQLDNNCIIRAIRRAEKLISTKPFQDIGAQIHWPRPERCLTFWNYSVEEQRGATRRRRIRKDQTSKTPNIKPSKSASPPNEYLECIIREVAVTGHHAGGTCAGGRVVDHQLRVKSVYGVRVMDASVFPAPVSLFPNSVLVAMAERAADIDPDMSLNCDQNHHRTGSSVLLGNGEHSAVSKPPAKRWGYDNPSIWRLRPAVDV